MKLSNLYKNVITILLQSSAILSYHVTAVSTNTTNLSKRGLIYAPTNYKSDYNIFSDPNNPHTPLTWYYNYGTKPTLSTNPNENALEFIPMIFDTNDASKNAKSIESLFSSSSFSSYSKKYVLTYNEPDGTSDEGGTSVYAGTAAQTYIDDISPIIDDSANVSLAVPATTGSPQGLAWLQQFNSFCDYKSNAETDSVCKFNFVATHFYGDFEGLASWLGQVNSLYPDLPIWLTEYAIPQVTLDETLSFLNQSMIYLDSLDYVEKYAWFGSFRHGTGGYTGDNVALLDANGGLTQLGVMYLGGEERGYTVGMSLNSASRKIFNAALHAGVGLFWLCIFTNWVI